MALRAAVSQRDRWARFHEQLPGQAVEPCRVRVGRTQADANPQSLIVRCGAVHAGDVAIADRRVAGVTGVAPSRGVVQQQGLPLRRSVIVRENKGKPLPPDNSPPSIRVWFQKNRTLLEQRVCLLGWSAPPYAYHYQGFVRRTEQAVDPRVYTQGQLKGAIIHEQRPMEYEGYVDFVIRIEPVGADRQAVRAVQSPAGEGLGPLDLPFDPIDIDKEWCALIQEVRSRRLVPLERPGSRLSLRRLAAGLFQALFPDKIRQLYERSRGLAAPRGLRLKLQLDPREPRLAPLIALPWELLLNDETQEFLSLRRSHSLVRHLEVPQPIGALALPERLRILVIVSNPSDAGALDVDRERHHLEEIRERDRRLDFVFLDDANLEAVRQALVDRPFHVLHYMGHGDFDPATGEGRLIFETPEGRAEALSGEAVARTLSDAASLRLVVLNACQSGSSRGHGGRNPFAGVAAGLILGGLPAVVAMQFPISDRAAIAFSRAFYRRIAAGDPVDAAVVEGRQGIHATDPRTLEWATPVLFSRMSGGEALFAGSGAARPAGDTEISEEELLDRYLDWMIEQTSELELPGLPKVDHHRRVALDTVYVTLRGDLSHPYERARSREMIEEQARRLETLLGVDDLTPEQQYRLLWRQMSLLARDPLLATLEERDRFHRIASKGRGVALDEALKRWRRLVILGDPGSGKTTLVRWLALQLARARRAGVEGAGTVELGRSQVPILLRIAAFAEDRKAHPERRLIEFVGRHLGSACGRPAALSSGETLVPEALHVLLRRRLEDGDAVVLLDGLDEIADPADRFEVAREIDAFLDAYLHRANRAVITSRIVGYQLAGLDPGATHLTLEPLSPEALERFCDLWMEAVHRATVKPWDGEARIRARREADALKRALAELHQRGAGELAGNPLLVTILALVFRHSQQSFPRQRIRLYELAVKILIEKWRERSGSRTFDQRTVFGTLVPLAAEIHESSAIGVIDEDGLRKVLERHLTPAEVDAFRTVVREEVGLLTTRGAGVYGFLHLTFQEYLAAHWLIAEPQGIIERLFGKLGDPRWREPILMALGLLSVNREQRELEELLLALLHVRDPLAPLLPRPALIVVAALPEMVQMPAAVLAEAARQLLATYAENTPLTRPIEQAFAELLAGENARETEQVLTEALLEPDVAGLDRAAARLVAATGHFTPALAEALSRAWYRDADPWPIDRGFREMASQDPALLSGPRGSLRRTLERKRELAGCFLADPGWRRLGLMIYGGLEIPRFYRDVPWLTRLIVDGLRTGRPPESLVPEFRQRAGEAETRVDALLALAALGEPIPVDGSPEETQPLKDALRRVASRVVVTSCEIESLVDPLRELAGCCGAQRWCDLVAVFLDLVPLCERKPELLLRLAAGAPPAARPLLLAQIWHFLLAGIHHDPVYNLAVVLDTRGDALSNPPQLLAESLAAAASHVPAGSPWRIEAPESAGGKRDLRTVLATALDALAGIPDPFDYVRGWGLVRLKPLLEETGLLDEALILARDLSDRFDTRAHTLERLRGPREPDAAELRTAVADDAPVYRAGLLKAPLLLGHERDLDAGGATTCLVTAALVDDLLRGFAVPDDLPGLWAALTAEHRDAAALELQQRAREHGLGLDRHAAAALGRLIAEGDVATVRELLPWVRDPGPEARGLIRDLLPHADSLLRRHGHLLLAEAEGFSARTLPVVLELLGDADDRTRHRAALALHGDHSATRRRLRTRRLGREALECLARRWLDRHEDEPRVALVLRWAFETIEHNDPDAITAWAATLTEASDAAAAEEAEMILGEIHTLQSGAWRAVPEAFESGSARAQRALLRSISTLLARRRLPPEWWSELSGVLRSFDGGVWEGKTFVLDGPSALVEAAEAAWKSLEASGPEAVDLAERSYGKARRSWAEVFRQDLSAIRETLTAIGAERLITESSRTRVLAAAECVAKTPPVLEVLIDQLSRRLLHDVQDADPDERLTAHLLGVVAAAAERLPNTYLDKVRTLPLWSRHLREVVEYGDWFPARQAALVLLGLGRRVTEHALAALRAALRDVIDVQRTARQSVGRYREIEPHLLPPLIGDLGSESPALALAAGRMLAALARNAHFSPEVRGTIVEGLAAAVGDGQARRHVYLLVEEARGPHHKRQRITHRGRLDELFHQLLVELAGMVDLFGRPGRSAEENR